MDKHDFKPDTRCMPTRRDEPARLRPLGLYVFRACDTFLVGRQTAGTGCLRRVAYADIARIVDARAAAPADRLAVPGALLEEKHWRDRAVLEHCSSSPALGK
jgi:hypothetical protein